MKDWIAKYQKAIVGTGAVSVLLICYFQQKELTKLRKDAKIQSEIKADKKTTDSLLNKLELDHDNSK